MSNFTDQCDTDDGIGVRRSVESFLEGIVDRVVQLDEERKEKSTKDSVEIFYNGVIDAVVNRLETQWHNYSVPIGYRDEEVLTTRPVLENKTNNLPTLSKALKSFIPISTLVVPGTTNVVISDNKLKTDQVQNQKRKESYLCRRLKALKFKKKTDKDIGSSGPDDVKSKRGTSQSSPVGIEAALRCVLPVSSLIVPEVKGHLEQTTSDRQTRLETKATDKKTRKYKIKRWKKKDVKSLSNTNDDKNKDKQNLPSKGQTFSETTLKSHLPAVLKTPTLKSPCGPGSNDDNDTKISTEMIDRDKKPKFKLFTRVLNYIKGRVRKDETTTVTMDTSEVMELVDIKPDIEEAEAEYQSSLQQKKKAVGHKMTSVLSRVKWLKCYGCKK